MSGDAAASASSVSSADGRPRDLWYSSAALITAAVPFFLGGALVTVAEPPPSGTPTLGLVRYLSQADKREGVERLSALTRSYHDHGEAIETLLVGNYSSHCTSLDT
ncbi:hypothetical protein ACLI4Z_04500 [Natrialbaceae archaeon A-arb3/5]